MQNIHKLKYTGFLFLSNQKEMLSFVATRMKVEDIMLSEISQAQTNVFLTQMLKLKKNKAVVNNGYKG